MSRRAHINISQEAIERFCKRNHIQKLSLFGSVLRSDFSQESDIDVLVEFEPGHPIGYIRLAGIEQELSEILGNKADLRTPQELSRYFRQEVLDSSEMLYEGV